MPSHVAWTTAALYHLYRHLLPSLLPLPLSAVRVLVRTPSYGAASVLLLVGIALQTTISLEQQVADEVGTWINR